MIEWPGDPNKKYRGIEDLLAQAASEGNMAALQATLFRNEEKARVAAQKAAHYANLAEKERKS